MTQQPSQDADAIDVDALTQMGSAVFAAQMFEALFVLVARSVLMCPDAKDIDDIAPVPAKAFKQPVAALLKELNQNKQVDEQLAERIGGWIENRHTLVHRLILSKPHMESRAFWQSMKDLSKSIYVDSSELCVELAEMFRAYAAKMPRAQSWLMENQAAFDSFAKFGAEVRSKVAGKRHG